MRDRGNRSPTRSRLAYQDGVITEAGKVIDFADPKRPDPIGITIGANGDPWYAESLVDSVATFKLR